MNPHLHFLILHRRLAGTWAMKEWNTGPQEEWLFDTIDAFLDAPLHGEGA